MIEGFSLPEGFSLRVKPPYKIPEYPDPGVGSHIHVGEQPHVQTQLHGYVRDPLDAGVRLTDHNR